MVALELGVRGRERRAKPLLERRPCSREGLDPPPAGTQLPQATARREERVLVHRHEQRRVAALGDELRRPRRVDGQVDGVVGGLEGMWQAGTRVARRCQLPVQPAAVVLLRRQAHLLGRIHGAETLVPPLPGELAAHPAVSGLGDRHVTERMGGKQHDGPRLSGRFGRPAASVGVAGPCGEASSRSRESG